MLNSISSSSVETLIPQLTTDAKHAHLIVDCQTYDHHPLKFSDHLPLSLTLSLSSSTSSTFCSSQSRPRLNWRAASTNGSAEAYAKCVDDIVWPYLNKTYNSISSLDDDIQQVSTSIFQAALSIIPTQRPKKCKKRFSDNPELKDLSFRCKQAWKRWKNVGRPSEGPELEEKRDCLVKQSGVPTVVVQLRTANSGG